MTSHTLQDLFKDISFQWQQIPKDIREDDLLKTHINDIVYDSRKAKKGLLFVAMRGVTIDGHTFCYKAYQQGCRHFLVDHFVELPADAIVIKVNNTRATLPLISANYFDHPAKKLFMLGGVTGTKGKTTTTITLQHILNHAGIPTASIGTLGADFQDIHYDLDLTTPESYDLQKLLRVFVDAGAKCVMMEVSSTALKYNRVDGLRFNFGIFTNFSSDHIGRLEHPNLEDYRDSKAKFFTKCDVIYINKADPLADYFASFATGQVIFYSCQNKFHADIEAKNIVTKQLKADKFITDMEISFPPGEHYSFPLMGKFNAENILPVLHIAKKIGLKQEEIQKGLIDIYIPGRTEAVALIPDVLIVTDVAHDGISVDRLLCEMKPYVKKGHKLMALISTISYRTDIRRKDIALAAAKYADVIMISTSWIGYEDPDDVVRDMASYLKDFKGTVFQESNRKKAIWKLINIVEPGDAILLADFGCYDYLIIGDKKIYHSDSETVSEAYDLKKQGKLETLLNKEESISIYNDNKNNNK